MWFLVAGVFIGLFFSATLDLYSIRMNLKKIADRLGDISDAIREKPPSQEN